MSSESVRAFRRRATGAAPEFVDELSDLYDVEETDTSALAVPLEAVARFLRTPRGRLVEILGRRFAEGVDYTVQRAARGHTGMLTPLCFGSIAMRSRGARGAEYRDYMCRVLSVGSRVLAP